jgi:anti-sigma B factor antagonist
MLGGMGSLLDITTAAEGDRPLVTVAGDLDAESADALDAALTAAVTEGVQEVIVDIAGVPFMDSSGFGALLAAHRAGATIVVRRPTDQVRRLLDLVAVPGVVTVEP